MILTISQACSMHSDFATDIAEYAAGGCHSVEIWLTKLEAYLESHSVEDTQTLLAEHGVQSPSASFQGGLFQPPGVGFDECWTHFEQRLKLCSELSIRTLVVACDITSPLEQEALDRLPEQVHAVDTAAAKVGVRIALEFGPKSAFLSNLQSVAHFLAGAGVTNIGICFDAFCFDQSSSKEHDLRLLTAGNLFHVQLSDADYDFREFSTANERILPGDGQYALQPLIQRMKQIGYTGAVSLELQNPVIWAIPPRQLAEVGMSAMKRVLGSDD